MDARRKFAEWFQSQTGDKLKIGDSGAFNAGGAGWKNMDKVSGDSKNMLGGIGEALKDIAGITKDIGPQIGAILLNNVGGSVDAVRAKIKNLGISAEDMKAAIIKAGMAAGKTMQQDRRARFRESIKPSSRGLRALQTSPLR
jgi:hypothetical protein